MEIILIILVAVVFAVGFAYFLGQQMMLRLTNLNNEQRKGNKEEIEADVKSIFSDITKNIEKQLEISRKEVGDLKNQNAAIREQLAMTAKATEGLQVSTDGLKNLLTNNRLRGEWGEQVADELLQAAGFVENVNYTKQTATEAGRPDITIKLPDGAKLNVDAKFPFDDLLEYQEAKTPAAKKAALSKFSTSIKNKVKGITSKDYINPEDNTLDFVVMFIPNEMIFSFIYEKLPDINEYCNKRKVVLAGPFGFTAVLRLVLQAYKNFGYEKNLQEIFGLVSKFHEEYLKFDEHMKKLGSQLLTTQKTYHEVEGARKRQLTKVVDKITSKSQIEPGARETHLLENPSPDEK